MDFSAFSHGQIQSKLWLCETLEPYLNVNSKIVIVGCWFNILGFMLLNRNPNKYTYIHGIDKDKESIVTANKICDAWMINENQKIKNFCEDVNHLDLNNYDAIICTSTEDISSTDWFNNLNSNKLVCLQSTNLDYTATSNYNNWKINNPNYSLENFKSKFPINQIKFIGEKFFDYGDLQYHRYMMLGFK